MEKATKTTLNQAIVKEETSKVEQNLFQLWLLLILSTWIEALFIRSVHCFFALVRCLVFSRFRFRVDRWIKKGFSKRCTWMLQFCCLNFSIRLYQCKRKSIQTQIHLHNIVNIHVFNFNYPKLRETKGLWMKSLAFVNIIIYQHFQMNIFGMRMWVENNLKNICKGECVGAGARAFSQTHCNENFYQVG